MIELPEQYVANVAVIPNASNSPTATDPIETVNQDGAKVRTRKGSFESTADWVDRHFQNVISEWEGEAFPLTGELCTCWFDSADEPHCVCTARNTGEDDADFLGRHMVESSAEMVSHPPAP